MISIHSDEEIEFIRSYVKTQFKHSAKVWIGLERNISQGFRWIDKSPFDYSKWKLNEPNNAGGFQPYVEMSINEYGTWNDLSDTYVNNAFICQFIYANE